MLLNFIGNISDLKQGIDAFAEMLNFAVSPAGIIVNVEKSDSGKLEVIKNTSNVIIRYSEKIHFFRGLGLFVEALREKEEFNIIEEPQFSMNGIMFDVSQNNAVITVSNVKRLITRMAVMGLNMIMLYTEDGFEIKDEPYFGYMRARYTHEELKELDNFADIFGIEMIPCIQTLAHLIDALKWECYADIREDDDTLLVGNDRTYEFIEKMIRSITAPFKTKRIHIGLDEAWHLGESKYHRINGCRNKSEIMTEHLERVLEITSRNGLIPMIWSDMFFRASSKTGDYYDPDCEFSKSMLQKVPDEVQQVYWEYGKTDEDFHAKMLKKHKELCKNPVFAGGIWSWYGFGVNYGVTFASSNAALNACKKEGISQVFATIWGDDGAESNVFSTLLGIQLYAEHGYSRELDTEKLKKRFKFCTGGNFEDFMDIRLLDEVPGTKPQNLEVADPSKYLLWQDILMGLFDRNIEGLKLSEHYGKLAQKMSKSKNENGEFSFVFELLEKVCSVLEIKSEIGLRITKAYKDRDMDFLGRIISEELPELAKRVGSLRLYHRELWMNTNKPAGWEVLDLRYGLLLMRVDSAAARIKDLLNGKIDRIEELDQERLYYNCTPGLMACPTFNYIPTASRISLTTRYFIW